MFVARIAEISFMMHISDPALCFDLTSIGQKVRYNQFKYECLDGFIKQEEDCLIILPSVHKQISTNGLPHLGELILKANVLPLNYEFQ
jgi:hypothetical protein